MIIGPSVPRSIIDEIAIPLHAQVIQVENEFDSFFEENNEITRQAIQQASIIDASIILKDSQW